MFYLKIGQNQCFKTPKLKKYELRFFLPLLFDDLNHSWFMIALEQIKTTEDDFWRKTTFDGRKPLIEDNFWRKMTFDERGPLTEDD